LIPSLDTYVYHSLRTKLRELLKHEDIVHESLEEVDKDARKNFIDSYCGENPKDVIEFSYSFPSQKERFKARIVVSLGPSKQTSTSIGNVESTYTEREEGSRIESSTVEQYDDYTLAFPLSHPIGELTTIEQISFSEQDNVRIEDNKILFDIHNNQGLLDGGEDKEPITVTIHYVSKEGMKNGENPFGVRKGYTSNDTVDVTPVSTNLDTIRCLDALLKVVMIIMGESPEEKNQYQLQSHSFDQLLEQPLEMDRVVFGRPLTLNYTVSTNMDFDFANRVKDIVLRRSTDIGNR